MQLMTNCIYCPQDELQNQDNDPGAVEPIKVRVEQPEQGCSSDEIDDQSHHKKPLKKNHFLIKLNGQKEKKVTIKASQNDFLLSVYCDQQIVELFTCLVCQKCLKSWRTFESCEKALIA